MSSIPLRAGNEINTAQISLYVVRLVTKAWGYFLSGNRHVHISSTGAESSPVIEFGFSSGAWYTLKSVVDGTNVKIYINDQLVKEIEMQGEGADSATDNYVGLWCHARTRTKGDSFRVTFGRV